MVDHKVGKLSWIHPVCCIRMCSQISYSYVFVYYLWNEVLALVKRSIKLLFWFCHVLFFFSTSVYKKMLSFLNLDLLWKIDSPEGGGRKAKHLLVWSSHCVWLQLAYLPSLCLNDVQPCSSTGCSAVCEQEPESPTAPSSFPWRGVSTLLYSLAYL